MREVSCKKCGNQIVWFNVNGRWQAVDALRVEVGDDSWEPARHGSHFENCKKQSASRGYIKPESYPCTPLTPEQMASAKDLRAIPADEELRISNLINGIEQS